MNISIFIAIFLVLMISAARKRRLMILMAMRKFGRKIMDMSVLKSYIGKKVRIRYIDSGMSQEEGFIEDIRDVWIVLKDKKQREKLIKSEFIVKIDILG